MITTLLLSSEKIKVTAQLTEIDILLIALIEFILETIRSHPIDRIRNPIRNPHT